MKYIKMNIYRALFLVMRKEPNDVKIVDILGTWMYIEYKWQ